MIPSKFEYLRAETIDQAIGMLSQFGNDAKLLAGGHSLLPSMKLRLSSPEKLIDIGRISELRFIRKDGNALVIGAGSTHQEIASSKLIKEKIQMFAQAGSMIGDPQVRNMGTIGGSLAHADPAADWPALVLASASTLVMKGPNGERTVQAKDFFKGLFMTALEANEVITQIRIPIPSSGSGSAYTKFAQPASRFALVGCAALIEKNGNKVGDLKLAFAGVGPNAFRDSKVENALIGKEINAANIEAAASQAAQGISVLSDHFASEEYRMHLAKIYAAKAISAAAGM